MPIRRGIVAPLVGGVTGDITHGKGFLNLPWQFTK